MQFGVYLAAGDSTTMSFTHIKTSGATDYGWRMTTAGNVSRFMANTFTGTLGAYLVPPTNFTTNDDTTNATLVQLETEVNELKAILRNAGLVRV
jgi:hypothetical protein